MNYPAWFTAQTPWAWGRVSPVITAGVGTPQTLLNPTNFKLGFSLGVNPALKGSQPSNQTPSANFNADALLNAVASSMACGPPSARWNNEQG